MIRGFHVVHFGFTANIGVTERKKYPGGLRCASSRYARTDPITGLKMLHGNGCHRHNDCFTCPEDDCTWNNYSEHKAKGGNGNGNKRSKR